MTSQQAALHDHKVQLVPYNPDVVSKRLQLHLLKLVLSLPAVDQGLRLDIESYVSKEEKRPIRVFESPRPAFKRPPKVFSLPSKRKAFDVVRGAPPPLAAAPVLHPVPLPTVPEKSAEECLDNVCSVGSSARDALPTQDKPEPGDEDSDATAKLRPLPSTKLSTAPAASPAPSGNNVFRLDIAQPMELPPAYAGTGLHAASPEPPGVPPYERTTQPGNLPVLAHDGVEYEVVGLLGSGGGGRVFCVRTRYGEWFAMKVVHKAKMYRYPDGRDSILVEKENWERITRGRKAFSMPLLESWDDDENVYFLMPLYRHDFLERIGGMNASQEKHDMKLYAAEAVAALANLHACGVVHRDVKPENFLLSPNGHLVLADFGLSWAGQDKNANLYGLGMNFFTGTSGYRAPEMVIAEAVGYDCLVDVWSLGITLLEAYIGKRLHIFDVSDRNKLVEAMITRDIPLHRIHDAQLQDLLRKMICRDVTKRWPAENLKHHPYFEGIDWGMLEAGYYKPDYRPPHLAPLDRSTALRFSSFHRGEGIRDGFSVHFAPNGTLLPNHAVCAQLELDRIQGHRAFDFTYPFEQMPRSLFDALPPPPLPIRFRLRLDPPPAYVEDEDDFDDELD